ncbi:sugar ABC transporter permease [Candidatus Haliotispira prima]|uniref:Sugar ABC transporter permease n=1 Tax=Candidatus Haliotispira prima TaxID=3034016 RepID=A0ABY8MJK1_9SPIO|nr:sugar ABC transporter permease [Candidatus Haliotispira prima]
MLRLKGDRFWGYLFIAPTMLGIAVLNMYPIINVIFMTLFKTKGLRRDQLTFVGMDNFTRLLQDDTFWQAMGNTIVYTVISVPLSVFFALVTAALLNSQVRGKSLFRTIFFTPVVVPGVALGVIWLFLLQAKYGIVNNILGTQIPFLRDSSYALSTISMIGVWSAVGYYCILFIAGMQSISPTFYEAARIDGAGPIRCFFIITLPLLSPTIFMVLILSIISGLQIFDLPVVMVGPINPAYASVRPVLEFFFRYTFNAGKPGIGSVVIVILLALIMLITAVQFRMQRKWVHYE